MVGHGGSNAGSYLADPTSPIPSHCALIVATSTLRVNIFCLTPSLAEAQPCHDDDDSHKSASQHRWCDLGGHQQPHHWNSWTIDNRTINNRTIDNRTISGWVRLSRCICTYLWNCWGRTYRIWKYGRLRCVYIHALHTDVIDWLDRQTDRRAVGGMDRQRKVYEDRYEDR